MAERTTSPLSRGIVQDLITTTYAMKAEGIQPARQAVKDYLEANPSCVAGL